MEDADLVVDDPAVVCEVVVNVKSLECDMLLRLRCGELLSDVRCVALLLGRTRRSLDPSIKTVPLPAK